MKVLIVGAGAVGQVYGRHLQLAGAEVTFFVREKYVAEVSNGFRLYHLKDKNGQVRTPVHVDGYHVLSRVEEVRQQTWDQVYLCITSTGLQGPWFEELARAIGSATLVSVLPGLDDRSYVTRYVPEAQLVSGTIAFASFSVPLPGDTCYAEPGIAYSFFPFESNQYSGADARRVKEVVRVLLDGGFPAKVAKDALAYYALSVASTMPLTVILELAGWSFASALRGEALQTGCRAAREAIEVASKQLGRRPPLFRFLMVPWLIQIGLFFFKGLFPFPLEKMLRAHYTKIGAQTRAELTSYVSYGRASSLPVESLATILDALTKKHASAC